MQQKKFGSFWFGQKLGFLEIACLKSFVQAGEAITLYSYNLELEGVPEGVELKDARTVLELDDRLSSVLARFPARFSDFFRLVMMEQTGCIWVDCDVYYLKPVTCGTNLMTIGRRGTPSHQLWNGVMHLEPGSELLQDYIALCQAEEILLRESWTMPVQSDHGPQPAADFFESVGKVSFFAENLPRHFFGPSLFSLLVSERPAQDFVQPKVHYPFGTPKLRRNIHNPTEAPLAIPVESETIHFFGHMIYTETSCYPIDPATGRPELPEGSLLWHAIQGTLQDQIN